MKSYDSFLDQLLAEATEADLKRMGASDSQISTLKARQARRGKGFETGDDRVKPKQRKAITGKGDPLAKAAPGVKKPAPATKASAAADPLKKAADKGSAIVRTKRGGTDKEAVGAPRKKSGPGVRVGQKPYPKVKGNFKSNKPYSSQGAKPVDRKPIPNNSALSTKTEPGSQAQQNRNKILNNKAPVKVNPTAQKAVGAAKKAAGSALKTGAKAAGAAGKAAGKLVKSGLKKSGSLGAVSGGLDQAGSEIRKYGDSAY